MLYRSFLQYFKKQPDKFFFVLFLLSVPLSVKKMLWNLPIHSQFNEFTTVFLYASDIFLILTLISWFFIAYQHVFHRSGQQKCSTWNIIQEKIMFHVEQKWYLILPIILFTILSLISIAWSPFPQLALYKSIKLIFFILLAWYLILRIVPRETLSFSTDPSKSTSHKGLSTLKRISEMLIMPFQRAQRALNSVPRGTNNLSQSSTWNLFTVFLCILIILGAVNATIGIIQFILQKSLHLVILGESVLNQGLPGVAKVIWNDHTLIRAYGLFPHPNILGGFLILTLCCTSLLFKMFHVELSFQKQVNVLRGTEEPRLKDLTYQMDTLNYHSKKLNEFLKSLSLKVFSSIFNVSRGTNMQPKYSTWNILFVVCILLQLIGLILTFSKSAFIAGVITFVIYFVLSQKSQKENYVSRGIEKKISSTWNKLLDCMGRIFHVEQRHWYISWLLAIIIGIGILVTILTIDTERYFDQSLNERSLYLALAQAEIKTHLYFGWGMGQFVPAIDNVARGTLEAWQYQPVHNVFWLIWSELGIFGLFLFILIYLIPLFINTKNVPRGTFHFDAIILFRSLWIGYLIILIFDHYFWDIQQGQLMFWLVYGTLLGLLLHNYDRPSN